MFKVFKIRVGNSKKDCCSITIQEVQDLNEEKIECCNATEEPNQSCCK